MRASKRSYEVFSDLKTQLSAAVEAIGRIADHKDDAASFSIPEFCRRHRISESQFHKLQREGRGPRVMATGSMGVRISRPAEADWIVEREREAEQRKAAREAESAQQTEALSA
jgi:hypothetical protein